MLVTVWMFRNNRRIRQHPRSFPTQNRKEHSWCTLLLLSLLPLFPLWGWLRAAPGKMTVTLADNVFHPGTHEWQKHVIIFEKECLLFSKAEFYLFFSFQGYLIFLLISHTTSFSCLLLNVVLCHFQAHGVKLPLRWLILLVWPALEMDVYDVIMPRLSVAWILKEDLF